MTLAVLVVASNVFVMRYPLLEREVDRFGNAMRLLLYTPAIAAAALFVMFTRREGP